MEVIQYTFKWLQGVTWMLFILVFLLALAAGYFLRVAEDRGMNPQATQRFINWSSTTIGLILGPAILFVMVTIVYPAFGRWVVNYFIPLTKNWQIDLQRWIDANVVDDLTSVALGSILGNLQLGLGLLFPLIGLAFKGLLKSLMNMGHGLPTPKWVRKNV